MSGYPPPGPPGYPPPGQGGYPPGGAPSPGYPAYGYPQQPPPERSNTIWWIVGGLASLIIICCCAGVVFAAWVADESGSIYTDMTDDYSASSSSAAQAATPVTEGQQVSLGDAEVQSGWSIDAYGEPIDVQVRNTGTMDETFYVNLYFMNQGEVVDETTCSVGYVTAGQTETADCYAIYDMNYDEIRMSEGY